MATPSSAEKKCKMLVIIIISAVGESSERKRVADPFLSSSALIGNRRER